MNIARERPDARIATQPPGAAAPTVLVTREKTVVVTELETVQVVVESLTDAGFDPTRIIIFDRSSRDLTKCGFKINESKKGAKCYATKEYVYPAKARDLDTKLSSILVNDVDALINMPVLKHHMFAGITASFKNHLGTVSDPRSFHPDNCSRLAELNTLDPIKKKTRLILAPRLSYAVQGGDYPFYAAPTLTFTSSSGP